jgi:alcohol dehydrogenase YqhD (iron-dependent ADH family)
MAKLPAVLSPRSANTFSVPKNQTANGIVDAVIHTTDSTSPTR